MRGTTGIVLLALNGPLTTVSGAEVKSLRTGKTLDAVERGFDAAKYRQVADKPALWVETYGVSGPTGAGPGHRVAVVRATALPYDVEGGWTEERRAVALARVVESLAEVCPGVTERLVASRLLTPLDIELEYGISGGHLLHGELAPDQLLSFRPGIEVGRYTTPIAGLFLGGGATHPGLGLTGSAGMLAAKAMLG
jgi:phytoene dehydrogenase-like protein